MTSFVLVILYRLQRGTQLSPFYNRCKSSRTLYDRHMKYRFSPTRLLSVLTFPVNTQVFLFVQPTNDVLRNYHERAKIVRKINLSSSDQSRFSYAVIFRFWIYNKTSENGPFVSRLVSLTPKQNAGNDSDLNHQSFPKSIVLPPSCFFLNRFVVYFLSHSNRK